LGPHLGNLEEGSSTVDFESWMKGALRMKHLSLTRLCGGDLRGSSLTGDPGRYVSLRMWASLSMGAPFHPRGTWYVGGGGLLYQRL